MYSQPSEVSSRVESLPLTQRNLCGASFHRPKSPLPFGPTKRESNGVSHLSLYIRPQPLQPYAIQHFTNIWFWPMPFEMAESGSEGTPRESCIADSWKRKNDSNRDQLKATAEVLRPLLGELVDVAAPRID